LGIVLFAVVSLVNVLMIRHRINLIWKN